MRKRRLGSSDMEFTVLGLGTWAIGGPWQYGWSSQSDKDSIATIHRAIDLGINWIDTAPAYGLGHSEQIVGEVLRDRRDEVFIATKCGLVWDDPADGTVTNRLSRESVRAEVTASLKRLNVDAIDLYQIHWPNPDHKIEEAWTEMAECVEEGLVRYIGVSNFSPSQVDRVARIHEVTSHQPPYSMFNRSIEAELLPYCAGNDIGVVVYGPMQSGLLTGKFTKDSVEELNDDDWRRNSGHFQEPELSVNLETIGKLEQVADNLGITPAQLAIAWTLRRDELTSAIVGARRPDQIEETVEAGAVELSSDTLDRIEAILQKREKKLR